MKHLGDLLAGFPLPPAGVTPDAALGDTQLVHDLGADLPAGHLHVWGGPQGAGKTSFLLSLLQGAALRRRRVVYASYHLAAPRLALRLLAMTSGIGVEKLAAGAIPTEAQEQVAAARALLESLPFHVLEARGMSVTSLEDRLVRLPFRPEVMAVDYLQAVIRPDGQDLGGALRSLSALASHLYLAIVVAIQGSETPADDVVTCADRAGWIAPSGPSGLRRAEVIRSRYGPGSAVPLRLDAASGILLRLPEGNPSLPIAP